MHPQQQQGMGPCKTGIMLGGMMGAGIGGSAGIILGGAGGFFSGYRGFALLKQSAKLVFSLVKSNTSQKDIILYNRFRIRSHFQGLFRKD